MNVNRALFIAIATLTLASTVFTEDCNKHCMQCEGRYGRNFCTLCYGTRNEFGYCRGETEGHCLERDPNGWCVRCEEGYALRNFGNTRRTCEKEPKSHKSCINEFVFPDGVSRCNLCKDSFPNGFDGRCEDWKDEKKFEHCAEATYGKNGYPQCYRCKAGHVVHYNSYEPFRGAWCVKEDDESLSEEHKKINKGCLMFDIAYYGICQMCDVANGYYKQSSYHRHCTKAGDELMTQ